MVVGVVVVVGIGVRTENVSSEKVFSFFPPFGREREKSEASPVITGGPVTTPPPDSRRRTSNVELE